MKYNTLACIYAAPVLIAASWSLQAHAQTTTLESGSNASSNSGSASQAASQSNPTNINAPVTSQGNLTSTSDSSSASYSGSVSGASSNQNQGQDQGQNQGQLQGQEANNAQIQGQMATNQQGVSLTFNSHTPKTQKLYTNSPVPLAASSSFSSDYCGGTASGGASAAPIGISFGGSGPVFDKSCQSLRRAEKFGMAAANASNMGQPELAGRLMSMMIWSICTSDSAGPKADRSTAQACDQLDLLGSTESKISATTTQPDPAPAPDPAVANADGSPTVAAAVRQPAMATNTPRLEFVNR